MQETNPLANVRVRVCVCVVFVRVPPKKCLPVNATKYPRFPVFPRKKLMICASFDALFRYGFLMLDSPTPLAPFHVVTISSCRFFSSYLTAPEAKKKLHGQPKHSP